MRQEWLTRRLPPDLQKLIVFLTPGHDWRSGGILSINWLCNESARLAEIHQARVVLCTVPGDPPLLKYSWFRNRNYILPLPSVLGRCRKLESIVIHVPEYCVNRVVTWARELGGEAWSRIPAVHWNVLVQNIDQVQDQNVQALLPFGRVTCTTAHEAYCNPATRTSLGVPLHRLSVPVDLSKFTRRSHAEKKDILIVSPDPHPDKSRILQRISASFPRLRVQEIRGLDYEDYLKLISRAKWSLTFGEGLDGYFIEPIYCGGVSFAVYNERFFTPAFAGLPTVYPSWDELERKIVDDMRALDFGERYNDCSRQARELANSLYRIEEFRDNLRNFYLGRYTFP